MASFTIFCIGVSIKLFTVSNRCAPQAFGCIVDHVYDSPLRQSNGVVVSLHSHSSYAYPHANIISCHDSGDNAVDPALVGLQFYNLA